MTTDRCAHCEMYFKVMADGTIRLHNNRLGLLCRGSGLRPLVPDALRWGW